MVVEMMVMLFIMLGYVGYVVKLFDFGGLVMFELGGI